MTSTTNDGVLLNVSRRDVFKRHFASRRAQKVKEWKFSKYHFKVEDIDLIEQLKCQKLCLFQPKYVAKPPKIEERNLVVSSFLNLRNLDYLYVYIALSYPLVIPSDLHKFVYRCPISLYLRTVVFVLPCEITHSLAKGLQYAEGINEVSILFSGWKLVDYMYQYFRSANLEDITFSQGSAKDCFALMKHVEHLQLQRLTVWDYSVKNSELVSKYVSGVVLRQQSINYTYGVWSRNRASPLRAFQNHVFKKLDVELK